MTEVEQSQGCDGEVKFQSRSHLVIVPFGKGDKDGHADCRDNDGTADGLQEDGVLNLAKCWLLDPDLTVEDFTKDVTFLVLGDPRFILVAVGAAEAVE